MRPPSFAALMLLVPLAGCAARGPFPSLAPRAVEKELAALDEAEQAAIVVPDDPAVAARVDTLLAEAREGQRNFEAASNAAGRTIRSAGPAGSDSWVEAQQSLSRLESARARTVKALGDLDAFALQRVQAAAPVSATDLGRIQAAIAAVQEIVASQQERISAFRSSLAPG
ncbi:hypothetical protein [Sphingosinicella rhizophila]|uniref:DUF4398 domain-containing protein n=1 Tax=Sphingosinicella rhizophila TaxID=3050082 RepID=A0ABU3Q3C1_9SPHN|nr:hypothetical protein [Sphingosinicella sp. GR2756]MDT9597900.1 hypothetical protein [Sphingosinicella sp. GR2756]